MKYEILRDFNCAPNGKRLLKGETQEVKDDLVDGLISEGYIKAPKKPK